MDANFTHLNRPTSPRRCLRRSDQKCGEFQSLSEPVFRLFPSSPRRFSGGILCAPKVGPQPPRHVHVPRATSVDYHRPLGVSPSMYLERITRQSRQSFNYYLMFRHNAVRRIYWLPSPFCHDGAGTHGIRRLHQIHEAATGTISVRYLHDPYPR